MAQPAFTHIHCSSRFDRSAASLEHDVDDWREQCSIITLTEVANDKRGATLAEKGWGYARAKKDYGRDECAVCYRKDTWKQVYFGYKKLNSRGRVYAGPVCSCDVILKHATSGHRVLISVTHMPSGVEGSHRWNTRKDHWQARKEAWMSSLENWSTHIKDLDRKHNPDAILIVCDWNLNLKKNWVRDLLHTHWGQGYKQAWVRFPTSGGSLNGGPVAPLGAPGKGTGDRIIDGTLYKGQIQVDTPPNLLATVRSSDHRPYKERFQFLGKADKAPDDEPASGDVSNDDAWWGFGDYMDDEIYAIEYATEEA